MTTPTPAKTTRPLRPSPFWRVMTLLTLGAYIAFLLVFLAMQAYAMLQRGTPDLTLNAEEAAELAVAQADRILGLLEVILGVVGLLLPLGLTVVVYIYNQSRATLKENEDTIEELSREAREARDAAEASKKQVTALQTRVEAALQKLNDQMAKSSETIEALGVDAEFRAEQLANSIDQQRREAEQRDLDREAKMDRQQRDFEEQINLQILALQQIERQMGVLNLILEIRDYEVRLLSDTYEEAQLSLNALIQYTYVDEDEEEGDERQHTRRREAVHALGTFGQAFTVAEAEWVYPLKQRVIAHLTQMAESDGVSQVRYEARRVLRDLTLADAKNGNKPPTSSRGTRSRSKPPASEQPTQTGDD